MYADIKMLREYLLENYIIGGNNVAAMFLPVGKEATGNLQEDLKSSRAISLLAMNTFNKVETSYRSFGLKYFQDVKGFGGYGAKRWIAGDIPVRIITPVTVYPETNQKSFNMSNVMGVLQLCGGTPSQLPAETLLPTEGGVYIADFGAVFNFKQCAWFSMNNSYASYGKISYSTDKETWKEISLTQKNNFVDFNARYIRYDIAPSPTRYQTFQWWATESNTFEVETIDKVILTRSVGYSDQNMSLDSDFHNYLGFVLDYGTEFTLDTRVTGRNRNPKFSSNKFGAISNVAGG